MDAIYELLREDAEYQSVVVLIDELNRGNAARIFGEFMTFLDFEYRDTHADGSPNPSRLPLPLRQVDLNGGRTEGLLRQGGNLVDLAWPIYFPRNVYLVATMNSVDRAAVPLDSALARRFERIALLPDLSVLAAHFGITLDAVEAVAAVVRDPDTNSPAAWSEMDPYTTTILLLDRINAYIASELGTEFELGHGLVMSAAAETAAGRWTRLSSIWDDVLFPQLEDRFAGRPEQLVELLKVEQPPTSGAYAWTFRIGLGAIRIGRSLAPVRLASLPPELSKRSLQWLAV
jgi:5-methylcytosine-specific restriction protein B